MFSADITNEKSQNEAFLMNDQPKRPGREEIFEVFRPCGDRDVSSENYRMTKPSQATERQGPMGKNQWIDKSASLPGQAIGTRELTLSGADVSGASDDPLTGTITEPEHPGVQTTIRLETFSLGLEDRLAAMQVAQQKAKDQLNELKKQNAPGDDPPAD